MGYLWEPFNPRHRPGTFPIRFPHYFHYVCAENGAGLVQAGHGWARGARHGRRAPDLLAGVTLREQRDHE